MSALVWRRAPNVPALGRRRPGRSPADASPRAFVAAKSGCRKDNKVVVAATRKGHNDSMGQTPVRALVRSAVELTSRHDRDAVLDTILGELERLVPFDAASVMLLDGDALRVVAGHGFRRDVDVPRLRFAHDENPRLARALAARGTLRFTDPDEPDPFDRLTHGRLDHLHSCMAAPMRLDGAAIGLITADAHDKARFDERHAELLELFAALAAVAIRNAEQVTALERARAQLEGEVSTLAQEIR